MKKWAYIFGVIAILYGCKDRSSEKTNASTPALSQTERENLFWFNSIDKKEVLNRLFDKPEFDSLDMVAWNGNYSDLTMLSIPFSYDGRFHSSLDTILYFTDTKKRSCAVLIFSTYDFQRDSIDSSKIEPTGCHFCGVPIGAALFHETEKQNWELYDFKKEIATLGYFGVYKTGRRDQGKIQLKEIGDKWTSLSITQGLGGNGVYLEGEEKLFSIEEYKIDGSPNSTLKLLLVNNYGMKESFLSKNILPEIRPIKKQSSYYDLEVRTIDDETVKSETYKYSTQFEEYLKPTH
jgi:hypothetical protein